MDQYPFEFKITVIGVEVGEIITTLRNRGFIEQAKEIEKQFNNELKVERESQNSPNKDGALPIQHVGRSTDDNEECPSNNYESGKPNGSCWGDGHYMCDTCKHFREDFLGSEGKEKRERLTRGQGWINIQAM
jgi:hypothetical protein